MKLALLVQLLLVLQLSNISSGALTKLSLKELSTIDFQGLSCDPQKLDNIQDGLREWSEAVTMMQTGAIQRDIEELKEIQKLANIGMQTTSSAFLQIGGHENIHRYLTNRYNNLAMVQMKSRQAQSQCEELRDEIRRIMEEDEPRVRAHCCRVIYTMVEFLIAQLEDTISECQTLPITINIEGDIRRVEVIRTGCQRQPEPEVQELPPNEAEEHECTAASNRVVDLAFNQASIVDIPVTRPEDLVDVQQYAYGFWIKYMTRHPVVMPNGINAEQYNVARLANRLEYQNSELGDRLLAIFLGQRSYTFVSQDFPSRNTNVVADTQFPDIENLWTFVHFAYSQSHRQAIGFIKFGDAQPIRIQMNVIHTPPTQLRLVLGGQDRFYPGFNGQVSRTLFKVGSGSFLDTEQELRNYALACNPKPVWEPRGGMVPLVNDIVDVAVDERQALSIPSPQEYLFPEEYGICGWFRWVQPTQQQQPNHLAFRATINSASQNRNDQNLGDRDLGVWLNNAGVYSFATYSYTNLNGEGNPNVLQQIPLNNRHTQWHFLFFAYSRTQRQASGYVQWTDNTRGTLNFNNINHYISRQLSVYVAKDPFYPSFSGQIANIRLHLNQGAINPECASQPQQPQPPVAPQPPVDSQAPRPQAPQAPAIPEHAEVCRQRTEYIQITAQNVAEIIRLLEFKQRQYENGAQDIEELCYCVEPFRPTNPSQARW